MWKVFSSKQSFLVYFSPISNRLILHFHGKNHTFWKRFFTYSCLFSALKKEPHPKVIIASCATYQLWLKVTIKILPTIFFSSAWYRTWWWLRGFFFTRRRKTYLFWRPIEFWRNSNKDAYSDPHLNNPFLLVTYAIFGISRLILSNDKLSSLVYKNVLFRFGVLYSSTIVPFGYWQKNST